MNFRISTFLCVCNSVDRTNSDQAALELCVLQFFSVFSVLNVLHFRGKGKSFNTEDAEKSWRTPETAALNYCCARSLAMRERDGAEVGNFRWPDTPDFSDPTFPFQEEQKRKAWMRVARCVARIRGKALRGGLLFPSRRRTRRR